MNKFLSQALFGALLLSVASCSKTTHKTNSTTGENTARDPNTLRVDVGSEVPSLDPAIQEDNVSSRIAFDLFAGLLDFNQQNNVIPGMASSWDISADGKTYTFHLRNNLKFSDGNSITASDFVYSWQRLVNPKTASPYNFLLANVVNGADIISGKKSPSTLGVKALDPHTFVVTLAAPSNVFLKSLALPNVAVVSKACIEKYGDNWTNPANIVTSGAYVLKEHVVNGYILAVKNPYYYDEDSVHIQNVKYYPYVDTSTAISNYTSGGLDITWQSVPVDQFAQLKQKYPKQLHAVTQEALYYYDINDKLPELKNVRLRQALSMAVDRKILVDKVLAQGQPALYSVVTPTIENGRYANLKYDWTNWSRDKQIAEAKKLYREAGYGPEHELHITISYNTNDLHKKVALAVASMWSAILGAKVTVNNQEWKAFIQARHKGNYAIARDGWIADYNSVTSYTQLYQCDSGNNNSHYCNPEYDQLLKAADAIEDQAAQQFAYEKALAVPLNTYAIIPLFQYNYTKLIKPYVENYHVEDNHFDYVQSKWFSLKQ